MDWRVPGALEQHGCWIGTLAAIMAWRVFGSLEKHDRGDRNLETSLDGAWIPIVARLLGWYIGRGAHVIIGLSFPMEIAVSARG